MAGKRNGGPKLQQRRAVSVAQVIERREKAWSLRVSGKSLREVAAETGVSLGQAHKDCEAVSEELRRKAYENAERHLQLSLERIDRAIKGIMPKVDAGEPRACEVLAKLEERRSKFLGLDAAIRLEHSGPAGAPITVDARHALLEKLTSFVGGAAAGGTTPPAAPKPDDGGS